MNFIAKALFIAGAVVSFASHASIVTFETATSTASPQADALAYRTVVDEALALPGARSATLALFDNASNQTVFGGSFTNIAFRITIQFDVSAMDAGNWGLRAGVDFGHGGAVFLDGVAIGFNANDMWWGGSYANTSQSFQFPSLSLAAGDHTLQIYGLEDCCDGGQQAQFSIRGRQYVTFGNNDGLAPSAVPEPEIGALMLAGLGVIGYTVHRRRPRALRFS